MESYQSSEGYIDYIDSHRESFAPKEDAAVFYSNDYDRDNDIHKNRLRAEAYCDSRGDRETLERTPGGRSLDDEKLYQREDFGRNEAARVWREASFEYAQQAQGDVNTFVIGSDASSIFRSVELPTLLQNEQVASINGIPREEIAKIYESGDHEAAFNKVCEGEIARDVQRAQGNPELKNDVAVREEKYQKQLIAQGRGDMNATQPMTAREKELAFWRSKAPPAREETPEPQAVSREDIELEAER